uniref:Zinc knuckle CX2CX4HX4C domain-containing protein n=1 Tax=Nelumbo nucifera TaxID=4432 RepID=A0A822XFP7_NELNU|nr:TPA_asm: hypothetical protein HUJ06_020185 [Nelumbo nucifera]
MVHNHVEIDLKRPLFRGFFLNNNNNPVWIRFAYESLTKLCTNCGLVGQSWKKCKLVPKSTPLPDLLKELAERKLDAPGEWLWAEHKPEKPLSYPVYKKTPRSSTPNCSK